MGNYFESDGKPSISGMTGGIVLLITRPYTIPPPPPENVRNYTKVRINEKGKCETPKWETVKYEPTQQQKKFVFLAEKSRIYIQ